MNKLELAKAYKKANKKHAGVCDTCCDESVMNSNGTCRECQDDYHQMSIEYRFQFPARAN